MPDGDVLICYDGSDDAKRAIVQAAGVLASRKACVLAVWQPVTALPTFAWSGAHSGLIDYVRLDEEAARAAAQIADEGVEAARSAGLDARPATVRANGPIWQAIVDYAQEREVGVIVMGARGLTGIRHMLMGSVSEGVSRNAGRPTLIVH